MSALVSWSSEVSLSTVVKSTEEPSAVIPSKRTPLVCRARGRPCGRRRRCSCRGASSCCRPSRSRPAGRRRSGEPSSEMSELGDPVGVSRRVADAGALQAGQVRPVRRLRDDVGDAGDQVAVVDRDVAVGVAVRLELRRSSRRRGGCRRPRAAGRRSRRVRRAGPGSSEPAMPWTRGRPSRWTGSPVLPSAKHGAQISGPPKAKAREVGGLFQRQRPEGALLRAGRRPRCRRSSSASRRRSCSRRMGRSRGSSVHRRRRGPCRSSASRGRCPRRAAWR